MVRQVLENGVILPAEYSDDWYDDMTSNLTKLDDVIGSDSEKLSSSDVGVAALSNNYNDLDNLPTIPTKTSDLTNDSNFVDTSNSAVSSGITSAKVTDYDTHIADTDIHVTTADKTKWNNQSYVFRYSSTALVASSTNSNTLLDNTDNLKVGDKVIDSSGVLFSITAIDTANSTFTIGTALVDLAQDSDVVHKSGDETVGGVKSFSDNITTKKIISNVAQLQINARSNADSIAVIAGDKASEGGGIWLYGKNSANNSHISLQVYDTVNSTYHAVRLNMDGSLTPTVSNNGLGSSSFKWVSFNGLNPSSLSLPSGNVSDVIDISSYLVNLDGHLNTYTAPANGWISIAVAGTAIAIISSSWSDNRSKLSDGTVRMLYPVLKGMTANISVVCTTLTYARFIPCQGNV